MTHAVTFRAGELDEFETARLRAERLRPHHLDELRRMHCDAEVMTHLGGVRTAEQTASYLEKNLKHWADYGFGLWILRERDGVEFIGRGLLRHLTVDGVDEVETGYAFYEPFWGRGLARLDFLRFSRPAPRPRALRLIAPSGTKATKRRSSGSSGAAMRVDNVVEVGK